MKSTQRPVNLDLTTFHFPVTAILSITHRVTGVLLFLALPLLIYALRCSLSSPESFALLMVYLHQPLGFLILWITLSATYFHLLAGIRHLVMDLGFAESLRAARMSAWVVLGVTAILVLVTGVYLW